MKQKPTIDDLAEFAHSIGMVAHITLEPIEKQKRRGPPPTLQRKPEVQPLTAEEAAARIIRRYGKSLAVLAD